jgi:glycosyltransferase involved in cell wall biosynthesis
MKFLILSKLFFGWKVPVIARNASTVSNYIKSTPTKIINHFFYKKVDAIISVSKFSAADINILFPSTKKKTFVIPIGIDEKITHEVEWKNQPTNSINVVHIGGFTFEKNHLGLLRIWKLFLESKPNAILHLLGDGPMKQKIEEEVIKMNLSDSIIFYGWTANPLDYIIKADMLVLPSIIEGLPGVILEAMYCRTTVVAYDVGGIHELIEHKQTGFLVGKNDELNFVNFMQEALTLDSSFKEKAFQLVTHNYTNKNIAKYFEKTYFTILK